MNGILIPCPKCGRELRLRDRSLLGKIGRCPQCSHRFPLEEPEEVDLELADAAPRAAAGTAAAGTSPRWIPDEPAAPDRAPGGSAPDGSAPGDSGRAGSRNVRTAATNATKPAQQGNGVGISDGALGVPASGTDRFREIRRRAAKRRKLGMILGGIAGVVVVGLFLIVRFGLSSSTVVEEKKRPQADLTWTEKKDALRANVQLADTRNPTRGEPIRLLYAPGGASIVFNLHPREMWFGTTLQEFPHPPQAVLAGLGGQFDEWSKRVIRELCLFEPEAIEEATICVHLRAKGEPPYYSAVVRLAEQQKRSDLILKFQSELTTEFGPEVFVGPDRAYMLRDGDRTVCIAPADKAEEMARSVRLPNSMSNTSLEGLLPRTDRQRQFTVVCRRQDLVVHLEELFPEALQPIVDRLLLWLGPDVDCFAWSAHQGTREFHSEFIIRPATASSPARLHDELRRKLDRLSLDILWAVERMTPETMGALQLIGRFPAMVEAFSLETLGGIGDDYVTFATVLPDRAGPNLTVATALTWDLSLRTDFAREFVPTQPAGPKLPDTIAGRFQLPIEIQFERMPLQQAFDFIAGEIQVAIDIDGDALKAAGMTKNMEQNQNLGTVPAIQGLQAILDRYKKEGMCIVVDEAAKTAVVTTIAAAEAKGQQPTLTPQ